MECQLRLPIIVSWLHSIYHLLFFFFFSILRVRTNVATAAGLARVAITYSIQPREWCPLSGD